MRRITGYLANKTGKTDRKQTKKNLIEYCFIGKFKQALRLHISGREGLGVRLERK